MSKTHYQIKFDWLIHPRKYCRQNETPGYSTEFLENVTCKCCIQKLQKECRLNKAKNRKVK